MINLLILTQVQLLYTGGSLGVEVHFVLKRLEIMYEDPDDLHRPPDIDLFLTNFCRWQRGENPKGDDNEDHWDHALVLTGLDLFTVTTRGRVNAQVVGLAPVAGMCSASSSCTVNEGRHFETVYVVAHEIGHNLGMRHDGPQGSNTCDPSEYLMSPTLGSGKISWSSCSRRYLEIFLASDQSKCLRDVAEIKASLDHRGSLLPGQRFPADMQCMLKHGPGSTHAKSQLMQEICEDLHCRRDHYTWTSHPALEGTSCGSGLWCRKGKCSKKSPVKEKPNHSQKIPMSDKPSNKFFNTKRGGQLAPTRFTPGIEQITPSSIKPTPPSLSPTVKDSIDSSWSECHSSCLYGVDGVLSSGSIGIQKRRRTCSTCRGQLQYRSCSAVRQCAVGNRRTLRDYANKVCRSVALDDLRYSGFASSIPSSGMTHCRVSCELKTHGSSLSNKWYPDGTACVLDSESPAYCMSGSCTQFTCEKHSQYTADKAHCAVRNKKPADATNVHLSNNWSPWVQGSSCRTSCIANSRFVLAVKYSCLKRRQRF